jgi:hypothetical protein
MSILNSTTPTANFGDYGDSVYRTKQYMYPTDLLSVDPNKNEYGGQYMLKSRKRIIRIESSWI